jgi:hypothetical protein
MTAVVDDHSLWYAHLYNPHDGVRRTILMTFAWYGDWCMQKVDNDGRRSFALPLAVL